MSVWIKRGLSSLAILGLLFTGAAQAQNGLSIAAGAGAVFEACPDPATEPVDVSTPCLGIVSFDSAVSRDERAVIVRGAGAAVRFNFSIVDAAAVLVPNQAAYWALADDPDVTAFTPDRPVQAFAKPKKCTPWPECKDAESGTGGGETVQALPSGVERIGGYATGYGGTGIGVAIVDTGLDFSHADLDVADPCFDAFGGNCGDANGHGTHVGGIVAALNNTTDVVGVAPMATLYAVRVLDASGSGTDSTVMAGLQWVAARADVIDVVNMSLGRPGSVDDNQPLHDAVIAVVDAGVTVVVAAGNDPFSDISQMVPASYPEVMAVASTTALDGNNKCRSYKGFIAADTASYFTTDGADVAISAPGARQENISRGCRAQSVGILSLNVGGGTTQKSGTSMAAPHVAGVVALVKEVCGTLTPGDVRGIIGGNAELVGTAPIDSPTGGYSFDGTREGIVYAPWAVAAASAATCSP
ncbi:MAG: S8 family serine peptidase [Proteobacteria bacterium]|nr:S8 family serine peptidase [Pseudomonadota bacterium]